MLSDKMKIVRKSLDLKSSYIYVDNKLRRENLMRKL